ncbi:cobyrinate a,c-diamide synthase, partial [Stomatohabitans albus]|uniref:cobyrinate a,c-diamide synthase n=1 Tax=Stomatohabitans albus TaxID=3110766 RepID=UPI00300C7EE7
DHYPTIVIGGTTSGVGKTSVATGLMAALTTAGYIVQGHKVGPDYIDPSWHELATGRPRRNLDVMMAGEDQIAPLVKQAMVGADISVIEGVMGLFDGAGPQDDYASTAHIARLLNAPIILVVDAANVSRSVAATVYGFTHFMGSPGAPLARIAGVIANRIGSSKHADLITQAVESIGVPMLGCLPRVPELATPSRHLGLIPVAERTAQAHDTVSGLGAWVAANTDIHRVIEWANRAQLPEGPMWFPGTSRLNGHEPVTIAVAEGEAFSFQYTENVLALEAAGARLVPFDPTQMPTLYVKMGKQPRLAT